MLYLNLPSFSRRGFTLIEVMFALGMFAAIAGVVSWIVITSIHSNAIIWEQLTTQNNGRAVLDQFVNNVRKAEGSSIGNYVVERATDSEFVFYANVDDDTAKERVRFWLSGTDVYRGVTHVTGTPLGYADTETVVRLAESVVNTQQGIPLFEYYDDTYPASQTPLSSPVNVTKVRLVRMQIELEKDPTQSPEPLHVETVVSIRSLKANE